MFLSQTLSLTASKKQDLVIFGTFDCGSISSCSEGLDEELQVKGCKPPTPQQLLSVIPTFVWRTL